MIKTSKFGGSSLANAARMKNAAQIIKSDDTRRYIVVSAPGVRWEGDIKITDLLYRCATCNDTCSFAFKTVENRLTEIIEELEIDLDIAPHIEIIRQNIESGADTDYIVSRGEYLTALIFAKFLGVEFVDAADIIKFKKDGLNRELTKTLAAKRLADVKYAVIPGFYGSKADGSIKTFSRGGSDYTGGIIADATSSNLYENWTDVSGFRATDPKIIKNAKKINQLSYDELFRLASMGASVLHPSSVLPLREKGIELVIKNTFDPSQEGTVIGPIVTERNHSLAGISVKKECTLLSFSRCDVGEIKASYIKKILGILDTVGAKTEFISTEINGIKVVLDGRLEGEEWQYFLNKNSKMEIEKCDISLFTLVGYQGNDLIGRTASAIESLTEIKYILKCGADLIIAISHGNNLEKALTVLYNEFF